MDKRPKLVTFIGYFYILGAIVLLIGIFTKQEIPFNLRFNLETIPEIVVRSFLVLFTLMMSYGYLKLKKWGFWVMIIYSVLFAFISAEQVTHYNSQPFIGNLIYSVFVLVYTIAVRKYFVNKKVL